MGSYEISHMYIDSCNHDNNQDTKLFQKTSVNFMHVPYSESPPLIWFRNYSLFSLSNGIIRYVTLQD
jgi:hypothetical protein